MIGGRWKIGEMDLAGPLIFLQARQFRGAPKAKTLAGVGPYPATRPIFYVVPASELDESLRITRRITRRESARPGAAMRHERSALYSWFRPGTRSFAILSVV